jgi:hypothetical protein
VLVYGRDLIYRISDFEKRVETVSLRPWQWDLLFALDGRAPLSDVAQSVGVEIEVAAEALRSLLEQGLVAVRSMRIDEYRKGLADEIAQAPAADLLVAGPTPVRPRTESAPLHASGEIAFSLKPPRPGSALDEKSAPPHGSIGFKIK